MLISKWHLECFSSPKKVTVCGARMKPLKCTKSTGYKKKERVELAVWLAMLSVSEGENGVKRRWRQKLFSLQMQLASLTLEQKRGFCTAAYPSSSRTSYPQGWFGRALKMKGDRQTDRRSQIEQPCWRRYQTSPVPVWICTVWYGPERTDISFDCFHTSWRKKALGRVLQSSNKNWA